MTDEAARDAYEAIAPVYDDFTHRNDYEMWIGALLPELEKQGLERGRVLDVGCGTGRAFAPMLERGWEVEGCDLSPAMVEEARRKFGERVKLHVADARQLPTFGKFELAWALNDVVNYVTEDGDLELVLGGMRANLAPGGLALFDANTLSLFRDNFKAEEVDEMSAGRWSWRGLASRVGAGGVFEAEISGEGIEAHVHRERHWRAEEIGAALAAVGLKRLAVLGQHEVDGRIVLVDGADENRDQKVIYIAGVR